MKTLTSLIFIILLAGCAMPSKEAKARFIGDYYSPQPCSLGSDFDLSLHADGSYRMIRTLPEGVGPEMPAGARAGFEEVGKWRYDGTAITLKPNTGKKLKLMPIYRDGILVLADSDMFGLRLEKQKPIQRSTDNSGASPLRV